MNLCDFYSHRLIGKLTVLFQTQEFNFRKSTVTSSTCSVWCSTQNLKQKVDLVLVKSATLRITFNLDGAPITSKSHNFSSSCSLSSHRHSEIGFIFIYLLHHPRTSDPNLNGHWTFTLPK